MKKTVGIVCVTVYLTLATVAAVLFGWLYFSTRQTGGGVLSKADAYTIINVMCEDLGFTQPAANTVALSVDAEEYNHDNILPSDLPASATNFKQWLLIGKELLNVRNDYEQESVYKSNVTFFSGTSIEFDQVYYAQYVLAKDRLSLNVVVFSEGDAQNNHAWTAEHVIVDITRTEDGGWGLACHYFQAEDGINFEHEYNNGQTNDINGILMARANKKGPVYAAITAIEVDEGTNFVDDTLNAGDITIYSFEEVNCTTHKMRSANDEQLTNAERLEIAQEAQSTAQHLKEYKYTFNEQNLIEGDFALVMKNMIER